MKFKNLLVTICMGLIISTPTLAASQGGYSGGGGDLHEMNTNAAWFLGQTPITYCIQRSEKFVLAVPEIQKNFEASVTLWKSYIRDRKIHAQEPQDRRLNLNFQYSGACTGTENLKIYLGVENSAVTTAKKKFEKPYAFAIRESYDLDKKMGKGFMWFAEAASIYPKGGSGFPNWHDPYTLQGIMTHELGHILGVGHVEDTIMEEEMMSYMQMMDPSSAFNSRGKAVLTSIDDLRILHIGGTSHIEIPGRISNNNNEDQITETFKNFMGRMPVGKVRMTSYCCEILKLKMSDDSSERTFDIKINNDLRNEFSLANGLFRINYKDGYNSALSYGVSGFSGVGFITSATGKTYTIQYSINASNIGGPVILKYIDGEKVKDLFLSNIKGSKFN